MGSQLEQKVTLRSLGRMIPEPHDQAIPETGVLGPLGMDGRNRNAPSVLGYRL